MKITSATFVRGLVGPCDLLHDETPQVAFIGRSNAGKSSLLNTLTNQKKLAITSKTPGRTKEINVFLVNKTHYFMDLPGYGYAKASNTDREKLGDLILWYLFESETDPIVVMLVDSIVGPTEADVAILEELENAGKKIIIVANKVDKIKKSHYLKHIKQLEQQFRGHIFIPFSSKTKVGVAELTEAVLEV